MKPKFFFSVLILVLSLRNNSVFAQTCIPSIWINNSDYNICEGGSITFTASVSNEGATPFYQWKISGVNVGTNDPTFTTTNLQNYDSVWCELTSSESCADPTTAQSNIIDYVNVLGSADFNYSVD